jgi:RNA polymerase sigma-70 factor, ECF subfamily
VEPQFKSAYFNHHARLLRVAYSIIGDRHLAEDIVQDVFLKLWKAKSKYKEIESLEAYLVQMTKNEALSLLDKSKKESELLIEVQQQSFSFDKSEDHSTEEFRKSLERAISQLAPQCRLIFTLSRFEGLSNDEIATYLAISKRTVETQVSTALRMFRTGLKPIIKSHLTSILFIFSSLLIN